MRILFALLLAAMLPLANAQAPDAIPVRIAYPTGLNGLYATVLERAAIPAKHGLAAEYHFFQYGPPMMEAMASGHVDVVFTSLSPLASYLAKRPGKALLVAQLGYSSVALMVAKDSTVQRFADLAGKRIAVSFGSDSHLDLLVTLKEQGLEPGRTVTLVNTPPNELMLALQQGFADAVSIRQPQILRLQDQIGARVVHRWPLRFIAVMRAEFVERHPAARARVLEALRESVHFAATQTVQASTWFAEKLRIDPRIVQRVGNEDEAFARVSRPADAPIAVTPEYESIVERWFERSLEFGMVSVPVRLAR